MDKFTKGVLVLIAVFLGVLVFRPLFWRQRAQRVYVTNFPSSQYIEGRVWIQGEIEIDDSPAIKVEIR